MSRFYKILVLILIVLLSLPALQFVYPVFPERKLYGVIVEQSIPSLSFSSYYNFEYQTGIMTYLDQNFGFRPFFIRLFNQFQFSAFNVPHGEGVVIGKENYLYEDWYIRDYLGYYLIGRDSIERKVEVLSEIQHFLHQYNTKLLVVLAPGKGWYYPEYIPDHYQRVSNRTNYSEYAEVLTVSDVPTFDVNQWFMQRKNEHEEPLFTQTGIHWSEFGAKIAADSLVKLTAHLLEKEMNQVHVTGTEWSSVPRGTDDDLERLMNVFQKINRMNMAYPILEIEDEIEPANRPSVIVISDSFFWNLYDTTLNNSFHSISFWYYYSTVLPESFFNQTYAADIAPHARILETDLVVLITSTAGLHKLGFGFVEDFYQFITLDENQRLEKLTTDFIKFINNSPKMLDISRHKSEQENITLEEAVFRDASDLAKTALTIPQ